MVSQETQKAIWTAWAFYRLPFGTDAERKVEASFAVLCNAPEVSVKRIAEHALTYWRAFMATDADKHPKLTGARLRKVDTRIKKLVRMVL
jgi:hypothetical protein